MKTAWIVSNCNYKPLDLGACKHVFLTLKMCFNVAVSTVKTCLTSLGETPTAAACAVAGYWPCESTTAAGAFAGDWPGATTAAGAVAGD